MCRAYLTYLYLQNEGCSGQLLRKHKYLPFKVTNFDENCNKHRKKSSKRLHFEMPKKKLMFCLQRHIYLSVIGRKRGDLKT